MQKRKQVDIVERPKFIDRVVERPVERIVQVPAARERETYRAPVEERWDEDRLERVLMFAQRTFEKKLKPLYYTIWKLIFHIEFLEKSNKQKPEKARMASPPRDEGLLVFQDGLLSVYHDVRRGIVDYLFEIFVRSANHAHQKKV